MLSMGTKRSAARALALAGAAGRLFCLAAGKWRCRPRGYAKAHRDGEVGFATAAVAQRAESGSL